MTRSVRFGAPMLLAALLAGCGPTYSPNTYASAAVQQANKVERGVVVGVRKVDVSALGAIGAVSGGAAGGLLGAQMPGSSLGTAFGTIGGTVIGGIVGATAEHAMTDTEAFEYVVRKPNGDLVSVTQKDETPLRIGDKVLVIAGNQARIVEDYTVPDTSLPDVPHVAQVKQPAAETAPLPTVGLPEPLPLLLPTGPTISLPGTAAAAIAPLVQPTPKEVH